ncbi:hypothetical protein FMM56_06725 [Campylobacter sp. LR264d]|nr:hypothetical protein FMM54_07525 [Campylobacter sp. LR185c]KAA6225879.1 hypothetical protein FMM55_05980 [Campylobacter sp. LR196d]KAA6230144.1 hypothetical protein FMM56_06725 [Campylobacter sp. LR264d]KAA8604025.1 hypothetical protein CGP82_04835 [Campylobacter sp. LR185c]
MENYVLDNDERLFDFLLEKSQFKDKYKKEFFKNINTFIFEKEKFLSFIASKSLNESYTSYIK